MPKIKAVLFDMDGVLIDAREWHYEALNKALALFGIEISRFDHLETYDGLPTKKKLALLSREKGLPEKLHPFIAEMKQIYTTEYTFSLCKPTFAHQMALSRLRAEGYRLAVCSNSIRETVRLMMERSDLLGYLEFFLSNEDVKLAKPHPEIYSEAMRRLGVEPQECLIIEDNPHGIEAAIASGGHVMQVRSPQYLIYDRIAAAIAKAERGLS